MKLQYTTLLLILLFGVQLDAQKVSADKSLLVGAQNEPSNGVITTDYLLWFNHLNGAFRAGRLNSDAWSPANTGTGSTAFGYNTIASGTYSMAINDRSKAIGASAFASGFSSEAIGNYSVALGLFAKAGSRGSIALGQYNIGNGNPTSYTSIDPLLEIGNGANSGNRANALTILKNGKTGLQTFSPSDRFHIQSNAGEDAFRVQIGNATKFRIFSNGSISMGTNNGNVSTDDVYIHQDLGIGINSPSERLDVNGAIKLGPSKSNFSGTIRFQNNDLEGRVGGEWKSLTNAGNVNGDVDTMVVNHRLYLGDDITGFYFNDFGTQVDHGKSLIFSKPTANSTGQTIWDHPKPLRNQGDFCFLETGVNPFFRINLGSSNYYFRKEGLSYDFSNVNINIGYQAGLSDTTTIDASGNTQIGHGAGKTNVEGDNNVLVGTNAGLGLVSGSSNTFIGSGAGNGATAQNSVAVGVSAGGGDFNTLLGRQAGILQSTGSANVMIGNNAGFNNNNNSNVFIGAGSGFSNTGTGNVFIGTNTGSNAVGSNLLYLDNSNTNEPLIEGNFTTDDLTLNSSVKIVEPDFADPFEVRSTSQLKFRVANNGNLFVQNRLGFDNSNPTYRIHLPNNSTTGEGRAIAFAWTIYSDRRVKQEVKPLHYGLQEILQLEPVKYKHFNSTFENQELKLSETYNNDIGFLAQDVHTIIEEIVEKPENENNALWSMNYEKLTPVLVKAIQEQQKIIEELKTSETQMKAKQDEMQAELNKIKDMLRTEVSRN